MRRAKGPKGKNVRRDQKELAQARSALYEQFDPVLRNEPELEDEVVAEGAEAEPFHRWMAYLQGYSPALVRRFLRETERGVGPILDPFNGSGTTTTEASRLGVRSVGVEAMASLAYLAQARALRSIAPLTEPEEDTPDAWNRHIQDPATYAALLCAAHEFADGEGRRRGTSLPLRELMARHWSIIQRDLSDPLPVAPGIIHGDARSLPLADESVAGVLTSPPYYSRYDYGRINRIPESLYQRSRDAQRPVTQMRAQHGRARGQKATPTSAAVAEVGRELNLRGLANSEQSLYQYFADLDQVIRELARVCRVNAPVWIVIGGSDAHHVHVPSDWMAAELAERAGFEVVAIRRARRFRSQGRRVGTLEDVVASESILVLRARPFPS